MGKLKKKEREERKGGDRKSREGATREEGRFFRGLFKGHGAARTCSCASLKMFRGGLLSLDSTAF